MLKFILYLQRKPPYPLARRHCQKEPICDRLRDACDLGRCRAAVRYYLRGAPFYSPLGNTVLPTMTGRRRMRR